ncbi:NAD(P)/FAD-dependent oxidoreductase [Pseudofrankia inefficax]|uniref:FAD-dependent pyridine nucleotide-disulfide oxidoreductase n=1 Tax=Pseudofrankia inefficax (strain DSM 45817 / CECT 9037 / DDB 130130 / EuI1c) TaxID=298654 RepID=E3J9X1_PSEI1|nr:FAD-dependent oxidoreductase [Pseudofrankia inefficax]ADP78533.1 FAD-dependent pyridine nucleotide-disulfide oxidoreductase [Pseudofrankia inefficax]
MKNSVALARTARMIEALRQRGADQAQDVTARPEDGSAGGAPPRDTRRPRVVVVGGGFAGLGVLRHLEARLPADAADLELVSPTDHLLYTSLLPQVCAGEVEPRHLAIPLRASLRRTTLRTGHAVDVDTAARTITVVDGNGSFRLGWDRLVLAPGSLTRTFDIPGLAQYGLGLKNLAEAVYLRDHVLRQLEYASTCPDPAERRARGTFVVCGAGYTGTELAAQMRRFTLDALRYFPRLAADDVRWILLDRAPRVLPELDETLGAGALKVLRDRGVEVWPQTSVTRVTADSVTLSNGETVPAHTLVWCTGVTPNPLMEKVGTETSKGRLVVDERLNVPGAAGVFALGDAAAVPDVTRGGAPAGQTAQHAVRQGAAAGRNIAASLGYGKASPYRHRDLGFVVDLGAGDAVANPLGLHLSGAPAALVTRTYHLLALGTGTNRAHVACDWLLAAAFPEQVVQLGFLPPPHATIAEIEDTRLYPN